jgi:hypothetical protein
LFGPAKAIVGLRPVFFGPRTLVRTWGTRSEKLGNEIRGSHKLFGP